MKNLIPVFLLFVCTGCSAVSKRDQHLVPLHHGDTAAAEQAITETIDKKIPNGNYEKNGDAAWLWLDRGTIRFAHGHVHEAVQDYHHAIEAIDYYNQASATEEVGRLLLQDELGAYPCEDHEQVLARLYMAMALLHDGDEPNACALLRQAEELQQQKEEAYRSSSVKCNWHLKENPLCKFLFAVLLERQGDLSNADLLYRQSGLMLAPPSQNEATLLFLCHNGNAPYKVSGVSDSSVASTVALDLMLADQGVTPLSFTGVPIPVLCWEGCAPPLETVGTVDGNRLPLTACYDVGRVAMEDLEQQLPLIVARGVARYTLRRVATEQVRRHDERTGCFVDLVMRIADLATKAETRCWTTLPATLDLAGARVPAGSRQITIGIDDPFTGYRRHSYRLHLRRGELCVVHIFNLHEGVTKILIPSRFLN